MQLRSHTEGVEGVAATAAEVASLAGAGLKKVEKGTNDMPVYECLTPVTGATPQGNNQLCHP